MPRRALRKIDPTLDLSRHFREAAELSARFTQADLFRTEQPLEVEVGTGKGLFLTAASQAMPLHNFVGIEIGKKYARYAAARLARAGCSNALVISGDALPLFERWFPAASLAAVHVYFPDPWWKARHKKRRVLNETFLKNVERTLVPGGRLHFWTDVEEYFQSTLALIAAFTTLAGPVAVAERTPEHDLDYRTHFERRTRKSDLPVYRAEFAKTMYLFPLAKAPGEQVCFLLGIGGEHFFDGFAAGHAGMNAEGLGFGGAADDFGVEQVFRFGQRVGGRAAGDGDGLTKFCGRVKIIDAAAHDAGRCLNGAALAGGPLLSQSNGRAAGKMHFALVDTG